MIKYKNQKGFAWGGLIGTLGGLIGLGGAEFRLPVLVGIFKLETLKAVILNKAMSLVVFATALIFRSAIMSFDILFDNINIILNLLAGSLIGAWWAAGYAIKISKIWLNRIILILLVCLALIILWEAFFGLSEHGKPLFDAFWAKLVAGVLAGFVIGTVAALLGVAGGELLIPTIVILYGLDIKTAGSLSLAISLPTMIVGFARYSQSNAFAVLKDEKKLFLFMTIGSILGAMIGAMLVGIFPAKWLMAILGVMLLISAYKTFKH